MQRILRSIMRGTAIRLCAVLWLFGYALVIGGAIAQGRFAGGMMVAANVPLLLLGIAQAAALSLLLDHLEERAGHVKWLLMAIAGLVAAMIQTSADQALLQLLALTIVPSWQDWAVGMQPQRLVLMLILYCWTMYLSIALVWAARATDMARLNEARAISFAAAASRAEAAALRLQLNPHFLFNTLNGISSLVVRGRDDEAEDMLGRLADFLRAALVSRPDAMVPIAQELGTIRAYLEIERARFGDRLDLAIELDPGLQELLVPNFLLQPLVENAVRHGVAETRGPGNIRISVTGDGQVARIELFNTSDGHGGAGRGHGIGIENSRRRLQLHYGDRAAIEHGPVADGYRVAIDLPMAAHEREKVA